MDANKRNEWMKREYEFTNGNQTIGDSRLNYNCFEPKLKNKYFMKFQIIWRMAFTRVFMWLMQNSLFLIFNFWQPSWHYTEVIRLTYTAREHLNNDSTNKQQIPKSIDQWTLLDSNEHHMNLWYVAFAVNFEIAQRINCQNIDHILFFRLKLQISRKPNILLFGARRNCLKILVLAMN